MACDVLWSPAERQSADPRRVTGAEALDGCSTTCMGDPATAGARLTAGSGSGLHAPVGTVSTENAHAAAATTAALESAADRLFRGGSDTVDTSTAPRAEGRAWANSRSGSVAAASVLAAPNDSAAGATAAAHRAGGSAGARTIVAASRSPNAAAGGGKSPAKAVRVVELRLHAASGLGSFSGRVVAVIKARAAPRLGPQPTLLRRLSVTVGNARGGGSGGDDAVVPPPGAGSHSPLHIQTACTKHPCHLVAGMFRMYQVKEGDIREWIITTHSFTVIIFASLQRNWQCPARQPCSTGRRCWAPGRASPRTRCRSRSR